MQSFYEYLTADNCDAIIRILAKERVKQGGKNKLGRGSKSEIKAIMPPRSRWLRLRQSARCKGLSKETANTLSIRKTIASDIRRFSSDMSLAPQYLKKLFEFLDKIMSAVTGDAPVQLFSDAFSIIAKFKEDKDGDAIYRPLCIYNDLLVKTLISTTSTYFTQAFDKHLHEEILSYRPRRLYHGKYTVTDGNNAITGIQEFIKKHNGKRIYVAECDIQKFFDIINSDVVLDCFDRLAAKAGLKDYHQARNILKAYLDSYGFVPDVLAHNDNDNFWHMARKRHIGPIKGRCLFKWVKEEDFMQAYTPEEFQIQRSSLGVPQGGALSCVIANVVLNDVDQRIIAEEDPGRFFARYGDDIILIHTDREKCEALLETYKNELLQHKLIFHRFEDFTNLKDGAKNTKAFWKGKSKPVFLWGPGEGNASEWIGFVGYEIRFNGSTRLRIATLNKKFGDINKKYHKCLQSKQSDPAKLIEATISRMTALPDSIRKFSALTPSDDPRLNFYLEEQLRSLDRYRYKKIAKLDQKLGNRNLCTPGLTSHFEGAPETSYFWRIFKDKQGQALYSTILSCKFSGRRSL